MTKTTRYIHPRVEGDEPNFDFLWEGGTLTTEQLSFDYVEGVQPVFPSSSIRPEFPAQFIPNNRHGRRMAWALR